MGGVLHWVAILQTVLSISEDDHILEFVSAKLGSSTQPYQ